MENKDKTKEELIIELELLQEKYNSLNEKFDNEIINRNQTNDSLFISNELFSLFMKYSPIYVFIKEVTEEHSKVLIASENFVEMIGIPGSQMIGKTMEELFPLDFAIKITNDDRAVVNNNNIIRIDEDLNEKNYTTIKFPITRNGKKLLAGYTIDITERKQIEEQLRTNERFLKEAQLMAGLGSYSHDIETGIWTSSAVLDSIFGIDQNFERTLDNWAKIIHPDWKDMMTRYFAEDILEKHEHFDKEYKIIRINDKQERWIHGLGSIEFDNKGNPIRISGTIMDITERKQAEVNLRESEQRYQRIASELTDYFYTVKVQDGKAIETIHSEACVAVTGYTAAEFNADPYLWINMVVPEEKEWVANRFLKILGGKDLQPLEHRIICKNGSIRWISDTSIPKYDSNGNLISYDGIIKDITERKIVGEALLANEQMLHNVLENFPGIVFWKDKQSRYLGCNQAFATGAGLKSPNEVISKTDFEMPWASTQAEFYQNDDREVMESGIAKMHIIETQTQKNNKLIWLDTNKMPLRDADGEIIGVLGVSTDITELKKAENLLKDKNDELFRTNDELKNAKIRAEESDRLKTVFLQNMSHEIRTPMNAIMGFSSLLIDEYNNKPKLEEYSAIIGQRCNDLLDIVNDILDIAKIESGQLPVNFENCNLNELCTDIKLFFSEHQKRIGKEHIQFSVESSCETSNISIITDKVKLKQILINLIGNAFKFTEFGKIEGKCKFESENTLLFTISDTGMGIPVDKQNAVFERFAQLNYGTNLAVGGTGLGLSIVKGLVNLLGGKIWLESEEGKGSTFNFTLPFQTIQTEIITKHTNASRNEFQFNGKSILIVEDDIYNAQYLTLILQTTGLNVYHTKFGLEAIQICDTQHIDLVLMDIRLPDMNGYDTVIKILQQLPNMKIVAQTAYASNDDKQRALQVGCVDYISKPTKKDDLLTIINKILV